MQVTETYHLPAVIAFFGFTENIQAGLRIPEKKGGGKASSLEEASGVELLCTLSNLRECSGTRCLGPHLCSLSTAR